MDLFLMIDTRYSRVVGWRFGLEEAQEAAVKADTYRRESGQWEQHSSDENRWIEYTSHWEDGRVTTGDIEVHRVNGPGDPRTAPLAAPDALVMEMSVTTPEGQQMSMRRVVPKGSIPEGAYPRVPLTLFSNAAYISLAEQIERLTP